MTYHPDVHHRRSTRLRDYDYAAAGAYFVTICAFEKACRFGVVEGGEMRLNAVGVIVRDEWLRGATVRPGVELDAFVVMPNHFHGIIVINQTVGATVGIVGRDDRAIQSRRHPPGISGRRRYAPLATQLPRTRHSRRT